MSSDPSAGLGTRLRRVLERLDGDLQQVYLDAGFNYRPRFTPVMKALADGSAKGAQEIARLTRVSQPAASQTLAKMEQLGLVATERGEDARERPARLTDKGRALLEDLQRYWRATEQAALALQVEAGVDLAGALDAVLAALDRKRFKDRVCEWQVSS